MNEVNVTEQEEIQELIPQVDNKPKPRPPRKKKKGASRKRSRNSSGASSVSIEVSSADDESNNATSSSSQSPCPAAAISVSSSTLLSVQTNFNQKEASKEAVSLASPAANSKHFKFPKTKRFFMNEWLNEKAQEASADSPLTVKTENFEPVAPTLNSPNAASVRDRTCSLDVSFGSAKKRWLRQAMQETSHTGGSSGSNSPVCNGGGGASPVTPSPAVSPNSNSMDFMTPLKKRMLRHSLAEERPSQYLLPKPEGTSLFDSSVNLTQPVAMEQPLLEVKEEEEERGDDINEEEVRKNSSIDSGLSVTTPADFERAPSFPALSDHSNKELTAVRKLDLDNKDDNTEVVVQEEEKIETPEEKQVPKEPELPKESSSIPEDKKEESPVKEEVDIVKPKQEEPIIVIPAPLAPPEIVPVAPPVVPVAPPVVPVAPITANHALKRCLSDEVSFSNGEINPAYFSPKKRHLYLRQNTDPGSSERSLGGTWPRQDLSQRSSVLGKVNEENSETLSQSWSGPSDKMTSDQEKTSAQVPGQPAVVDVSSDHHVTTSDPHLAPVTSQPPGPLLVPVHGHPHPTSPVPGTSPSDPRARIVPPVAPISHVADQRLVYVDPRCQLQDVSLLEYRKRKGSSTTKRPPENAVVEEEPNEQLPPGKPEGSVSPTSSTESSPDKPSKPANIITFKDVHVTNSGVTPEGLQSLPLFSQAPIAETSEGKKLSLTDEAHKLITSLTQVLMEGKGAKDQQNSKVTEPTSGNEDPLQRMRRELNEKNTEKVLALKRAHSLSHPLHHRKRRAVWRREVPQYPSTPPRIFQLSVQIELFVLYGGNQHPLQSDTRFSSYEGQSKCAKLLSNPRKVFATNRVIIVLTGIHSPKAGGLQRQANHVVVAPPPGVLGVQQVAPQTNGGHVVYSQVIPGNTPPVAQYQQPIAKHQAHSPRGQNHYSPIAASTSPRGPLVGTLPTPHPNNFQFQHKNHVEESLLPPPPVPNQIGQFYNGDRGGFHVNGDHHVNRVTPAAAAATVAVVTETARPSSQFPSNKFSPVHDKRSSSYSRSSRALSPRRGYHRH
ncbi:putative mucin-17 isoform X4 [Apostichopus japonicus]|uniref:Putative mucin-17 isoform X4 n=1 Tax=Stichopus japonicus TaxID=307972 RepID=A0A2G8KXC9_STIJA|nr:putative mucin-17 isoform X4 [Apostichopus japonicus]